jgi:hypothetical protein
VNGQRSLENVDAHEGTEHTDGTWDLEAQLPRLRPPTRSSSVLSLPDSHYLDEFEDCTCTDWQIFLAVVLTLFFVWFWYVYWGYQGEYELVAGVRNA